LPSLLPTRLPSLPLLLWGTPPGLELILSQECIAYEVVREAHPLAFVGGRFVLYDGRRIPRWKVRGVLSADHVALDVEALRRGEPRDPFAALIDDRARKASWLVEDLVLSERVSRHAKGAIRRRLLNRLREAIVSAGGVWARLAPYPYPYRSAFGFRADLDEPRPDDYFRFAEARRPLDDCTTHFVSTHAYGSEPAVLDDLRGLDTQSHGHYHLVYRDADANRRNLERAQALLSRAGLDATAFAAPEGRWNPGLDRTLEALGYAYSSEFSLGYDDFPFFPWRDGQFSKVLQVPVHPICEGLFVEAGLRSDAGHRVARYLTSIVRAKISSGEPAFVYGHPERRLGRMPEVLAALAETVASESLLWRTTMTAFARWWIWRSARRWSMVPRGDGTFEVQFRDWNATYPLALEIVRGSHTASVPIPGPRTVIRMAGLAFERRRPRVDLPAPTPAPTHWGLRPLIRAALDWETITPLDELPDDTLTARLKKTLRRLRSGPTAGERTPG
jgi:hypothetical protein